MKKIISKFETLLSKSYEELTSDLKYVKVVE